MPRIALSGEQKIKSKMAQKARELKGKMAECGVKQSDVAQFAGLTRAAVNKQLNGKAKLSIITMYAVELLTEERGFV